MYCTVFIYHCTPWNKTTCSTSVGEMTSYTALGQASADSAPVPPALVTFCCSSCVVCRRRCDHFSEFGADYKYSLSYLLIGVVAGAAPHVGAAYPFPFFFSSLVHSSPHLLLLLLFSFLVRFTYFLLSSIFSLSTTIVTTPFPGGRS